MIVIIITPMLLLTKEETSEMYLITEKSPDE